MIIPFLACFGVILEYMISIWIESQTKRAKGQVNFRRYHPTIDYLITFNTIMEVCCNNKLNILSCFVEFKKDFYIVPRNNLLKILKELKVYFELRAIAINLY